MKQEGNWEEKSQGMKQHTMIKKRENEKRGYIQME